MGGEIRTIKDDGFRFEETDDPRTFSGSLVPDCENTQDAGSNLPVLEYISEFRALIDACGQVSYFYHMRLFVAAELKKAKEIASEYNHSFRYYDEQLKDWRAKATKKFVVLKFHGNRLGYSFPEQKSFLNELALSKDRRDAYKGYLNTCLKKQKTFSPDELENKFQKRLKKRLGKAKK
jgi:hypothetical protein